MRIVITGGHHSSALPVIKEINKREHKLDVFWVGHRHSVKNDKNLTLEYKEVTDLGVPFYNLHAGKFYRTYDPIRLLKIPFGFFQAFFYLLKVRPKVILSFGGYLAVPVVLAGWILGIPSITHEQTVVVGWANKLISKFAKKILISWKDSENNFPKEKIVFTGLPLREEIFEPTTNNFEENKNLPTIYITAGKTGSHKINQLVLDTMDELLGVCNIIHQCGDVSLFDDFKQLSEKAEKLKTRLDGTYNIRKFVFSDEIGEAFDKACLVVSRSGAHTMAELLALGKKAVLIPIPWVSHNEQFMNAKMLEKEGLGVILEEKDLNSDNFVKTILDNLVKEKTTSESAKASEFKDPAIAIVDEIYSAL